MDGIITLITLLLCALPVYSLQCKFALGSYSYDICPLIFAANNPSAGRVIRVQQDQQASPTAKRTIYDIDLAGDGLIYDRSLPSSQQASVFCLILLHTNLSHSMFCSVLKEHGFA